MIRLGLLGCADIAVRRVLPAVARVAGIETAAVGSRDEHTAWSVARRFGADAARNYQAVLDRPDIDAVYVPLPPALHAEWVERALRAGKHVLAEKPLTLSPDRSRALVALARSAGLVLLENYMFVHHGQHRRIRRLLADGAVGEPQMLSATFAIPPRPPGDIRYRQDLGGGALFDVGGYPVRAALLLLGPELEVAGASLRYDPELGADLGVDLGGSALLRRPDGVTAQLCFGMAHLFTSSYEVLGSTGRVSLAHAFTPPADHAPVVRLDRRDGGEELVQEPEDQCAATITAFVTAIRARAAPDEAIVQHAELIAEIRRIAGQHGRQ